MTDAELKKQNKTKQNRDMLPKKCFHASETCFQLPFFKGSFQFSSYAFQFISVHTHKFELYSVHGD